MNNMPSSQELSPTTDANLTRSLMNIHESLLDEFKDEAKFNQLGLTDEEKEAWIMVSGQIIWQCITGIPWHDSHTCDSHVAMLVC